MPEYLIYGFDRDSGEKVERYVVADTKEHAIKRAGIVVESVHLLHETDPDPIPMRPVESMTPDKQGKPAEPGLDTGFANMEVVESAMTVIAALSIVAGIIVSLVGIGGITNAGSSYLSDEAAESAQGFALLTVGVSCFFAGVLFAGFSCVLKSLRVIAVNSYRE